MLEGDPMNAPGFKAGADFPLSVSRTDSGMQFTIRDIFVILSLDQVRELRDYLDMEYMPPFVALGDTLKCLRVYQEDDGMAWFRVYHTEEQSGRISCFTDAETDAFYEWLNSQLDSV